MKAKQHCRALVAALALAFAFAPHGALAQAARDPIVTHARANEAGTVLQIVGIDFPTAALVVTLGDLATPLVVTLATPTLIEARLPAGIAPGTYLVTLGTGKGNDRTTAHGDEMWITLGTAGPQGPAGPAGAQGMTGPQGLTGPQGVAGLQGVAGPQGPTGSVGAVGAQGPAGGPGPVGATGAPGARGPQGFTGPQGPAGNVGPAGPAGAAGANAPPPTLTSFFVVARRYFAPGDQRVSATAECPEGSVVTGGWTSNLGDWAFDGGIGLGNGWYVSGVPGLFISTADFVSAYAICLRIG